MGDRCPSAGLVVDDVLGPEGTRTHERRCGAVGESGRGAARRGRRRGVRPRRPGTPACRPGLHRAARDHRSHRDPRSAISTCASCTPWTPPAAPARARRHSCAPPSSTSPDDAGTASSCSVRCRGLRLLRRPPVGPFPPAGALGGRGDPLGAGRRRPRLHDPLEDPALGRARERLPLLARAGHGVEGRSRGRVARRGPRRRRAASSCRRPSPPRRPGARRRSAAPRPRGPRCGACWAAPSRCRACGR